MLTETRGKGLYAHTAGTRKLVRELEIKVKQRGKLYTVSSVALWLRNMKLHTHGICLVTYVTRR